jgi:hypothetical protein
MKRINTSFIVDPDIEQPMTSGSINFLQDSNDENIAAAIKAIVLSNISTYSLTTPYVISGCVVTSGMTIDVTAGEVFYGGKHYETTAITGSTNPPQFINAQTQDPTADPIEFSDLILRDVHDIFTYVPTDTATPGDFSTTDLIYFLEKPVLSRLTVSVPSGQTVTSGSYVDLTSVTLTTPDDGLTRNWLILYNSYADQDNTATNAFLDFRIVNGALSTTYGHTQAGKVFSGIGGNVLIPVGMHAPVLTGIPPNTVIKAQSKTNVASCTVYDQVLTMIEI